MGERSQALNKELKIKNKDYEIQINDLNKEKATLEDDKRNLDLKVAQIKDEMKKLKRNQNSGLGFDRNTLQTKEKNLFNINDIQLNVSPSPNKVEKTQQSDDDDTGIVPPGSHDFNFSEIAPPTSSANNNSVIDIPPTSSVINEYGPGAIMENNKSPPMSSSE